MKYLAVIALLAVVGCKTETRAPVTSHSWPKDRLGEIYAELKSAPIPMPPTTPFDTDTHQRDTYLAAFRAGWDFAIRGDILFGLRSQPLDLPHELTGAWEGGWREGAKEGGDTLANKLKERP